MKEIDNKGDEIRNFHQNEILIFIIDENSLSL